MSGLNTRTTLHSLHVLFNKGVRFSTVIDVGCADGSYFLSGFEAGLFTEAVPVNIDANALYEDSLEEIRTVLGGHFRICAITDHVGEIELTTSLHAYWSSLRPEGDPYWERVNTLSQGRVTVPATTLDNLRNELALKPPFLLKLDVQGAEEEALRGGGALLQDTDVIICETDIDDFEKINSILTKRDFVLFDATELHWADGALGWFYPIYIHRRIDFVRPKNFWDAKNNNAIIQAQVERRNTLLKYNTEALARIQNRRKSAQQRPASEPSAALVRRNSSCSCGSGKKYKHCCGSYD
jgi:FkbM family methyltransferase